MYGITDNGIVDGLGKPAIKFEVDTNDELKRFLTDNKETFIENYVDVEPEPEQSAKKKSKGKKKALNGSCLGKLPADVFNVPEQNLKCFGHVPTYQRLTDYSHLIDTADNVNTLTGYGFNGATLKTLIDTVDKYRLQVAKLAKHLKGDTPEQSAFNIWHWLHTNVKYNYDTAGKEEIRTPARTWQDRESGVDCDCLSVFTACLLINMGYAPKFEIVAFANKPQYSHIFVNLDGIAIDRVLPMFNRRPSLITKTKLMDIPVYQLSGIGDVPQVDTILNGLYESTLSKIYSGTATKKDKLDYRKTQVLVTLKGVDYNGYRLAGLLMPYVTDIDEMGNYYFDNEEIANIAANGENELVAAELRGADEITLGKLFKKIGKALKKAAKKVASGVKKVAKATTTAVKTVAKQTAKVTKAAVKSTANAVKATANVVKAGAQAAVGRGSAAKATLKKAGNQIKSAVVEPVKTTAKATTEVVKKAVVQPVATAVKVTVVEPTKTAVKATAQAVKKMVQIGGKMFKVIFVKLNPVTVLMRNSLRLLVAINFMGMATRLMVGKMTQTAAEQAGYTKEMWEDAKKAYNRVVKFFTKMGGKEKNIEKAIANGSKKKALFKKDYKPDSKIVETDEDNAALSGFSPIVNGIDGLGDPVTVGSALAAVGAFFAKIWGWIKNIVPKLGKGIAKAAKATGRGIAQAAKKTVNAVKTVANKAGDVMKKAGVDPKELAQNAAQNLLNKNQQQDAQQDAQQLQTTTKTKNLMPWLIGAAGVLAVGGIVYAATRKKKAA